MGFLCNANASDQGFCHLVIGDWGLFHQSPGRWCKTPSRPVDR